MFRFVTFVPNQAQRVGSDRLGRAACQAPPHPAHRLSPAASGRLRADALLGTPIWVLNLTQRPAGTQAMHTGRYQLGSTSASPVRRRDVRGRGPVTSSPCLPRGRSHPCPPRVRRLRPPGPIHARPQEIGVQPFLRELLSDSLVVSSQSLAFSSFAQILVKLHPFPQQ